MKKTIIAASLVAIGFAFTAFVNPKVSVDNNFEGVVTYSVSVDNEQIAAMMQGSTAKTYIKGDNMKVFMDMNVQKMTIYTNKKTPNTPVMLMEMMGNKYQVKQDTAQNKDMKEPVIKYSDETKTIAGYTCHKADVTNTDNSGQAVTTTVYYTQEIPYFTGTKDPLKGLKGFPMEFSVKQPGFTISFLATGVAKQSISDDTFTVPSGYKLMSMADIMQDAQKQMSGGN